MSIPLNSKSIDSNLRLGDNLYLKGLLVEHGRDNSRAEEVIKAQAKPITVYLYRHVQQVGPLEI